MKKMYIVPKAYVENMGIEDALLLETSTAIIEIEDGGWVKEEVDNLDWTLFEDDKIE